MQIIIHLSKIGDTLKISSDLLKKLDLASPISKITTSGLDRLPLLISERALENSGGRFVKSIIADFAAGTPVSSRTFSMPRKGFGPRPITMLSARDRVLYDALIEHLRPKLPPESRSPENWEAFRAFGLPGQEGAAKYVVSLDIASMYEYVDHEVLRQELLVQTLDHAHVDALVGLLREAFGFSRGLPQMVESSDLLGDVYIATLERELLRHGYQVKRYADDFRVPANDWGVAHRIIEHAAEAARNIGLVLSSEKTTVRLSTKLADEEAGLQGLFENYFADAVEDLTVFDDVMDWYGESAAAVIQPDEREALHAAFHQVLIDWAGGPKTSGIPPRLVSKAIQTLGAAKLRVDDSVLMQVVWEDPLKLSTIVKYMLARAGEGPENLCSLNALTAMERQSPWAKLWLLRASDSLNLGVSAEKPHLEEWAGRQLEDEHEVVRAEAAWLFAGWGLLEPRTLVSLFGEATRITRSGLAAALGRSGLSASNELSRSITGASPLYKDAFDWGTQHDTTSTVQDR